MAKRRALLIIVGVLPGAACSSASDDGGGDRAAVGPCIDYADAFTDLRDGLLTDAEFRAEMREIVDDAEGSAAEPYARDVLAAITSGTTAEMTDALAAMNAACGPAFD